MSPHVEKEEPARKYSILKNIFLKNWKFQFVFFFLESYVIFIILKCNEWNEIISSKQHCFQINFLESKPRNNNIFYKHTSVLKILKYKIWIQGLKIFLFFLKTFFH